MPNNHQHYLQKVENQLLSLSQKDFSLPNRLLNQSEVLLQILMLDLFPILSQLLPLYSGRKGGRNHRDAILSRMHQISAQYLYPRPHS